MGGYIEKKCINRIFPRYNIFHLKILVMKDVSKSRITVSLGSQNLHYTIKKAKLDYFPFDTLNPLQTVFYETYKSSENALIVAPTSSGKTGVALLFMKGRGTYAVPTKALANEIYGKFSKFFGKDKVGLKTGDVFEELETEDKDIYVCTYESLANALRLKKKWVSPPLIIDEIHHIFKDRGVVLEEILAHIKFYGYTPFLSLSATVPDPEYLAELIGAEYLLVSSYRPVPVKKIYRYIKVKSEGELVKVISNRVNELHKDEKTLIFVHKKDIGYKVLESLNALNFGIMNKTLPFVVNNPGEDIAFHNADIPYEEREEIEMSFRKGNLNVLIATQTLAYGVNLPADRVIVFARKIRGNKFIPDSLDIFQMEGRAGRYGIKDKGFVEVYVWTRSRSDDPEGDIAASFYNLKPYLSQYSDVFSPWEYWGKSSFVALMILGAVNSAGKNWKRFISNMPSIRNLNEEFLESVYGYLEENGFIHNGRLTRISKVLLMNSISPLSYIEMKERIYENLDILLCIRPLMYMKRIKGSLKSFLGDDLYKEIYEFKRRISYDFNEDGSDELWIFTNGRLFHYPNISNPPGELSFSYSDLYHLARALYSLREEGFIFISDEDILRVLHSYKYGVPIEYSPVGGISGVGFIRANAIYKSLSLMGINRVNFGKFEFPEDFPLYLESALNERYNDNTLIKNEKRRILRLIKKDNILADDKILKILLILKKGKGAIRYIGKPKRELLSILGI